MNFPMNNYYGLTTDYARFLKAGIDANQHLSAWEKYMEKCAISNQIADPIDREAELCCDWVDRGKEYAQDSARHLLCSPFLASITHYGIEFRAEMQKQQIHQKAENAKRSLLSRRLAYALVLN